MTKRDVVMDALEFRRPAYVPWAWDMTVRCAQRCQQFLGTDDLSALMDSHFYDLHPSIERWQPLGNDYFRDIYGVTWNRSIDKDIGTPCDWPLKRPEDLARYPWPNADEDAWYADFAQQIAAHRNLFCRYSLGFSLYERAWTMRGMDALLMDMVERPEFVEKLLDAIVEHNLQQVRHALTYDIDAVYFGDDYGMQTGLIMGIEHWRHFFKPRLARMFAPVRAAGKYVCLHSCGRVVELFDDLVEIGLNVFNPFQPEVMDVFAIKKRYHGRLAFHGGMSVQKVLPLGTVQEVRTMTQKLLDAGRDGGYVFASSHDMPADVPPENILAMVDVLKAQPGYRG